MTVLNDLTFVLHLSYLYRGYNDPVYFMRLWGGFKECIYVKHLEQWVAHTVIGLIIFRLLMKLVLLTLIILIKVHFVVIKDVNT